MESGERVLMDNVNEMQADLIAGMLEEEGIPFYLTTKGAGSVYHTQKLAGVCIYVAARGYDRAKELIDVYFKHLE